jgi:hypothetical protein
LTRPEQDERCVQRDAHSVAAARHITRATCVPSSARACATQANASGNIATTTNGSARRAGEAPGVHQPCRPGIPMGALGIHDRHQWALPGSMVAMWRQGAERRAVVVVLVVVDRVGRPAFPACGRSHA